MTHDDNEPITTLPRILFVDDEPAIPRSLRRMVRSYSIEADTEAAGSADEALARLARGGIDVVISDVRMPGMDGIELLARLKADPKTQNIPVIMLTGDGDASVKNVALELGAAEFVNKPADSTELCARLRNVLRLKVYQDQLVSQTRVLTAQIIQAQKMEIAGILASQAAHDLNNILAAIAGTAELALYKKDVSDVHPDLEKVVQAAQHAARLVRQIRDFGRRNSEEPGSSDPQAVIDECIELLKVVVPPDISLDWAASPTGIRAGIEATALHQVVMNLIINAVHAMNDTGTLTLRVAETEVDVEEATTFEAEAGHYVKISVQDTGSGIEPATLPHIFEPFFTTKGEGKGTGIGLSVVDRIVRGKGGFIRVDSEVGAGTTFTVLLPIHDVSTESSTTAAASSGIVG